MSPNGTQLAFVSDRSGSWDVYVMKADGTDVRRLTTDRAIDTGPAWSPDGRRIAFATNRHGKENFDIYVMNPDGTRKRRLTRTAAVDTTPSWSPTGDEIVFASNRPVLRPGVGADFELYVMRSDGTRVKQLTRNTEINEFWPAWSPDGRTIAYTRMDLERDDGTEIYTVGADGSGTRNLTRDSYFDWSPAWSPDGRKVIFTSDRTYWTQGTWGEEVFAMNPDGSGLERLTRNHDDDEAPSWQPVGRGS